MELALDQPVLVLNRLWQAVNVIGARRAFALLAFHGVRHPMGSMEIAGDGYIAQERHQHKSPITGH